MIFTADQLVVHALGDYIFQSDWMAQNKAKRFLPAAVHALTYSALFLIFRPSLAAFAVILGTHFLIDRYRLARYLVWAKNWLGPIQEMTVGGIHFVNTRRTPPWEFCTATGYPPDSPAWLSVWLMIIADNILHVSINAFALKFLGGGW